MIKILQIAIFCVVDKEKPPEATTWPLLRRLPSRVGYVWRAPGRATAPPWADADRHFPTGPDSQD